MPLLYKRDSSLPAGDYWVIVVLCSALTGGEVVGFFFGRRCVQVWI